MKTIDRLTANHRISCAYLSGTLRVRYCLSYWDSLIVAAALQTNCTILYSEDMQNGLVFDEGLRIVNPLEQLG